MKVHIFDHSAELIAFKNAAVDAALEEIGTEAEKRAVEHVDEAVYSTPESPSYVRTGDLRKSITHRRVKKNAVAVGARVNYARYVEFGTRKMRPRPFIKPAVANHLQEYKAILERHLGK